MSAGPRMSSGRKERDFASFGQSRHSKMGLTDLDSQLAQGFGRVVISTSEARGPILETLW